MGTANARPDGTGEWTMRWIADARMLALLLAVGLSGLRTWALPVPETVAVTRGAQISLDAWPSNRIFDAEALVLPTRLVNPTDQPLAVALRTALAVYRPNEDGALVEATNQVVALPPGGHVDLPAVLHPDAAGPYEFRLTLTVAGQVVRTVDGALLYRPQKWVLPDLEPGDFDAFWARTLAETRSRPLDAVFAPPDERRLVPPPFREVSFNGFGTRRIRGYLGMPPQLAPGQKVPAILSLPSAGYHSAVADPAAVRDGYVFLAISIHDLPFGGETYRDHPRGRAFDEPYQGMGRQSKESFYYRAAYAAGPRAVDFLRSLPEVDPNRIIVTGFSQGGSLALVTAGLVPDLSLAEAGIAGRSRMDLLTTPYKANMSLDPPAGMTARQMLEQTLLYYDVSYFARRVRCPVLMRVSLDDETNPGPLQYWAFRQLTRSSDARLIMVAGLKHATPPDPDGLSQAMRRTYVSAARLAAPSTP
jgi:cephalosporin-C deacetylase